MEAQSKPCEEGQRDHKWLVSVFAKIPSIPRFSPAIPSSQKEGSYLETFKITRISKSAITPKIRQDGSSQDGVNESRSKGKQKSLSTNEESGASHSRSDESRQSNEHTPITRQRTELVAVNHTVPSGDVFMSANNGCVSAITVAPAVVATATTVPPAVEEPSRKHVKKMAHDCYVDLAQPLSPELERAWDTKIYPWLDTNLLHSMDDLNYISAEFVMAGPRFGDSMYPTVLIMCRDLAQKKSIEEMLKVCPFMPKNVQRRIIIFDILKCSTKNSATNPPTEKFCGRQVAINVNSAHGTNILYANVAEILPVASDRLPVFCTIGGMLSVNGKIYGLTTAHPLAALGDEEQVTPIVTSGITLLGHVAYALWPSTAQGEDDQVDPSSTTYSRGEDWALVEINRIRMTYNTFYVPGAQTPQRVTDYVKTADLSSGEVWVCAGVSGVQLGFLKQHPASIIMSRSLFAVRSISLERPLVDGDSGSWVVRGEKLCGFIFCRTGNEVEWAYMLPIEAAFESISEYWKSLHPDLPSPAVQIAGKEVVEAEISPAKSIISDLPTHDGGAQKEDLSNTKFRRVSEPLKDSEEVQATSSNSLLPRNPQNPSLSPLAWALVVISFSLSIFLHSLNNVIVADIQPSIIKTVGHIDKLPWISVAYALGSSAVNLLLAKLYRLFNRKMLFIYSMIIFGVGSAVCGTAPNMTALIFGRVICGIGSTGIQIRSNSLFYGLTTAAQPPSYGTPVLLLSRFLGTILGPVIGAAFSDRGPTWRWSFYFNLCVGAVATPIYIILPSPRNPLSEVSFFRRIREIDLAGSVLLAGAYICLILAIADGGIVYVWSSAQIIVFFAVSGVIWAAFAIQQALAILTTKENRLVPIGVFRSWETQNLFTQIVAAVTVVYVPLYFIPLYFQFVRGDTALHAAVRLLPFLFTNAFGMLVNRSLMHRMGYYMPWYLFGGILSIAGGLLLTFTVGVNTSPSVIYGYSVLCGLGSGLFMQASFAVVQMKVPLPAIGLAIDFLGYGQTVGITLALAISHTIFVNQATDRIARVLPSVPGDTVQQAITGVNSSFFNTLAAAHRARILDAIVQSINRVYSMVVAAGLVVVVLALLMKKERISKQSLPTGKKNEKNAA